MMTYPVCTKPLTLLFVGLLMLPLQPALVMRAAAQDVESNAWLRLYDNFQHSYIDPTRWVTEWGCSTVTTMECRREIENGHLVLRVRAYGDRNTNIGAEYGNAEIYLAKSSVTDLEAQVTVARSASAGCTTSPGAGTHSQSLIWGEFFNGGGGTASDDVQAFLVFDRYSTDPQNLVGVYAFLNYQGTFFSNVTLGTINLGEAVHAELKWDPRNHQFVVRVFRPMDGQTLQATLPYTISDSTPAVVLQKGLGSRAFPENCVGTQIYADTETWFGHVRTD